jgi:hypothetical protein
MIKGKDFIVREWHDNNGIAHLDKLCELVRCGDCDYSYPNEACDDEVICRNDGCAWDKNGYCSDGIRRRNETN